MKKKNVWLVLITLTLLASGCANETKELNRPIVGTVRWDGLFEDSKWASYLVPKEYQHRLPFYTIWKDGVPIANGDSQSVMDKEIAYAKDAGLDYWAFVYYYPNQKAWTVSDKYNYGWKRYLSSEHKKDINFCLILSGGGHLGPKEKWKETIKTFVRFFDEPTYQRVAGGRPLVYVFTPDKLNEHFGSVEAAKQALEDFRSASINAGHGSPYIACMAWHADGVDYGGKYYVDNVGYDAISAYTHPSWTAGDQEYPYSELAAENASFWDECKATGKQVIPVVNTGWDNRPMRGKYAASGPGPWYTEPTMAEWKNHLQASLNWVDENPSATESNSIVVYSWIELTEGGWLVPTLGDGTKRIKATGEVLNAK